MPSVECGFLESLSLKDIEPCMEKWIAIVGRKIVALGKDFYKVCLEAVKMTNGKTPPVERIPASLQLSEKYPEIAQKQKLA